MLHNTYVFCSVRLFYEICYLFVKTMHKGGLKLEGRGGGGGGGRLKIVFSDITGVMNENIIDKILFDFMQWVL